MRRIVGKRPFSDILFDIVRSTAVAMFEGRFVSVRRTPEMVLPISSDHLAVSNGERLSYDRRALPGRKTITIRCDRCGHTTHAFILLRNWQWFLLEKEALAEHFKCLEPMLYVATVWNEIALSNQCIKCDEVLECHIDFNH